MVNASLRTRAQNNVLTHNAITKANKMFAFHNFKNQAAHGLTIASQLAQAASALQAGDVVTLTGYMYWYNGANPHITKIAK